MAKIPFDIKYKPQIESGEYKVETKDGRAVEIVKWNLRSPHGSAPILAIMHGDYDYSRTYSDDGYSAIDSDRLFIITSEKELTPFEEDLIQFSNERNSMECDNLPEERESEILVDHLHRKAAELLALAREQFIKEGYVIEKKAFHDAVEKVDQTVMKEVYENIDGFVDLDLPSGTLWADSNVGANSPEKYGDYFNCDESQNLNVEVPTKEQWDELLENCESIWAKSNGVIGRKFISKKNGNSIFLPAAGDRFDTYLCGARYYGRYWSSSRSAAYPYDRWRVRFNSIGIFGGFYSCYSRFSIRPVKKR